MTAPSDNETYKLHATHIIACANRSFKTNNDHLKQTKTETVAEYVTPGDSMLEGVTAEQFLEQNQLITLREYFSNLSIYSLDKSVNKLYSDKFTTSTYEVFKYDTNEFYMGFCAPDKSASREPVEAKDASQIASAFKQKTIAASPNGYGIFLSPFAMGAGVKIMEGVFLNNVFVEGQIINEKSVYIGHLKEDAYCGSGILYYWNEKISKGNYVDGKLNGKNCILFAPSEYGFIGEILNDSMTHGTLHFFNDPIRIKYEGDLLNGKPEKYGEMVYRDKSTYKGQWKDGLYHGKGAYQCPTEEYNGDYVEGMKSGRGKLVRIHYEDYQLTDVYDGDWKIGLMHGIGTLIYGNEKQKSIKKGIYKYGKLEKYIEENQ